MSLQTLFYDDQDLEQRLAGQRSVFLAGPTARGVQRTPWRARALERFEAERFDGTLVLPEFRDLPFEERVKEVFSKPDSRGPGMQARSFNVLHWETLDETVRAAAAR